MIAIIGDIHGCYYTLEALYKKIVNSYPQIQVFTVGDLVDRGNYSREVINFVIEKKILFTPGNHDYMFYHFFKEPSSIFAKSWFFNGNETTLLSYEKNENQIFEHIEIIKSAPLYYNLDDCFISHAGISQMYENMLPPTFRANLEILKTYIENDLKNERGILWTRDPLLNLGKLQVVGHTKQTELTFVEESNAIYIDTGACVGNKLSAVIVHGNKIVDTIEEKTNLKDII
ncbi:metallophosphoesterase [Melioribacteraceae bacterium 4301-Me]|uniref:metallophosphoesterase n=1 Tax=Pyranulibacter aquaticus TaxID=3163344 RepID=UPI00359875AB